jgi:sugar lactone lactonase YvrE
VTFQTPPFVQPWGIELSQDQKTLYISEVTGRIYKADLTQPNPTP